MATVDPHLGTPGTPEARRSRWQGGIRASGRTSEARTLIVIHVGIFHLTLKRWCNKILGVSFRFMHIDLRNMQTHLPDDLLCGEPLTRVADQSAAKAASDRPARNQAEKPLDDGPLVTPGLHCPDVCAALAGRRSAAAEIESEEGATSKPLVVF